MQQTPTAKSIMISFAQETGLTDKSLPPRRYLWTDAFAVCNYLGLYQEYREQKYLDLALALVDQVHLVLGQYDKASPHHGWLSGLEGEEALRHPTKGGLRIGKKLPERQAGEPVDERLEWDRDGQYYHYLTKWIYALSCVSHVTGKPDYYRWALELALHIHSAFVYQAGDGSKRIYWKMSLDLSRPLISSMGQHDPLDGFLTYQQLKALAQQFPKIYSGLSLTRQIEDMAQICDKMDWATADPLSLGGLCGDAYRLSVLIADGQLQDTMLLTTLFKDITIGLQAFMAHNPLSLSAEQRLGFRELGISIGFHALEKLHSIIEYFPKKIGDREKPISGLETVLGFHPIANMIESFWLEETHRLAPSWSDHADINNVMLATSLSPDGYLMAIPSKPLQT